MHEEEVALVLRIYNLVLEQTETFEDSNIGAALAYLMAAILKGSQVDIQNPPVCDAHTGPLWQLLCDHLNDEDEVFDYFNHLELTADVLLTD
jgi:hypothetical protein